MNKMMKLLSLLVLMSVAPMAYSQIVVNLDFNTFVKAGAREATLSNASSSGASLEYLDNPSGRVDTGMYGNINSGSLTTFTQVGDTMSYSFSLSGITATNNNAVPVYRVGFRFDTTAALRYETSTGTGERLRFGSNNNGNPFSSGVLVGDTVMDWSGSGLEDIRFDDGKEIDATVSLELTGISGSLYDYLMTVSYASTLNPAATNTASRTFTGVGSNEVTNLFHVTNSADMVAGDAWTISDASLQFAPVPEPATYGVISGFLVLALVFLRRKMSRA